MLNILRNIKHKHYLKRLNKSIDQQAKKRRDSDSFKTRYAALNLSFIIPEIPTVEGIWGISMVKNEVDIIEESLRHMVSQGVDQLLVVDNGSDDGTYELLLGLSQELPLIVGLDNEPAYYQSEKMTWLADRATEYGAKWIIPFDADEFWMGYNCTIRESLHRTQASIAYAKLYNQFKQLDKTWALDSRPHPDSKVAFRPNGQQIIEMGNHAVLCSGLRDTELLWVLHRPWRSFEQFKRKLKQGAASLDITDLPEELGYHWRRLGTASEQELKNLWDDLVQGKPVPEILAWRPVGRLVPLEQTLPRNLNPSEISPENNKYL